MARRRRRVRKRRMRRRRERHSNRQGQFTLRRLTADAVFFSLFLVVVVVLFAGQLNTHVSHFETARSRHLDDARRRILGSKRAGNPETLRGSQSQRSQENTDGDETRKHPESVECKYALMRGGDGSIGGGGGGVWG